MLACCAHLYTSARTVGDEHEQKTCKISNRGAVAAPCVIDDILSFLPTAVLSTRFRYVFAHVHTLSFQAEKEYNFWSDAITFDLDSEERRSTNGDFVDTVISCAAPASPTCSELTTVSLLHNKRLRRLALLCCHSVVSVSLDASESELRFLHYRGAVPPQPQGSSLFAFHGGSPRIILSSTIKFCGPNQSSDKDLAGFRSLLENLEGARHLHLNLSRLGCSNGSKFLVGGFPPLSSLHKLELTGGCLDSHSITRVLQQTRNLEILSLFLKRDPEHSDPVIIPDASAELCLQQRLKEINLVHYRSSFSQRILAQLLFGNALVLQALCVVSHNKALQVKATMVTEIKGWVVSKSPKMSFL